MTRRIRIFDTTLRDGSQREGIAFSVEDKREVITALDSLGVDFVEAGMPQSNPKDAELFGSLPETKCEVVAFGSTCRPGMSPEEDRWVLDLAEHSGDWVCVFGKAWRMQAENVLHVNEEENSVTIAEAGHEYDLRDVPPEVVDMFLDTGLCLGELDELLIKGDVVYEG